MHIGLREFPRVPMVCCVELVCMVSWHALLVHKMTRALSNEKQENVHSMLRRGYGQRK